MSKGLKGNYFGYPSKQAYMDAHNGETAHFTRVAKIKCNCDFCGKEIYRYPKKIKKLNFCSKKCVDSFANKKLNPSRYMELKDFTNMSETLRKYNLEHPETNPMFQDKYKKIQSEIKLKWWEDYYKSLRIERTEQIIFIKGKPISKMARKDHYIKHNKKHIHRLVAEEILGRKLFPGEVVHHIDEDKTNNNPENIIIFPNQAEHARWHALHKRG